MDKNIENSGVREGMENCEEQLAPLRALDVALRSPLRFSTSQIQLCRNDRSTTELVAIEGEADENTLKILHESISDVIASQTPEKIASRSFQSANSGTSSSEAAAILNNSSSDRSATATTNSFYSIPSCTSSFEGIVSPETLENAEEVIADLERNGPAGLVHLSSLSAAIGKPIRVWCSGSENSRKVGRTRSGDAVDIEFHEPGPDDPQGHWTLRGNVEPRNVEGQINDCLFSVVADQIGRLAPELRAQTITRMRKDVRSLAHRIDAIAKQEGCDRISLLVGGARYTGQRPQDAKVVIDNSQQGRCHPDGRQGHPRGHASHPGAGGATESAENYSHTGRKSAFMSREDQDAVGHLVLETDAAQSAMERLNRGGTNEAVRLNRGQLAPGPLPEGLEFYGGTQQGGPRPIKDFVIVLRHHQGQENNPEADVFVHTFYPVLG